MRLRRFIRSKKYFYLPFCKRNQHGAGIFAGGTRDQGSFLDIAKNDNPLAKNNGMEEQENQDGVLARTWTSQNVRMYRTKHALLKTCWNYVFSVAGFRRALAEPSAGKPTLGCIRMPSNVLLICWQMAQNMRIE